MRQPLQKSPLDEKIVRQACLFLPSARRQPIGALAHARLDGLQQTERRRFPVVAHLGGKKNAFGGGEQIHAVWPTCKETDGKNSGAWGKPLLARAGRRHRPLPRGDFEQVTGFPDRQLSLDDPNEMTGRHLCGIRNGIRPRFIADIGVKQIPVQMDVERLHTESERKRCPHNGDCFPVQSTQTLSIWP